jgi:signal transduction histidine kinase
LNTPLTPLKLQMHMLRGGRFGALNPEQAKSLDVLQRNFDRLSRLVQDILDVARLQGGRLRLQPEPIDLGPLVRSAVNTVAPQAADADVRLRVDGVEPLHVVADPDRVRSVFESIMGHALRYTGRGGVITVRLARTDDGGAHLAVADDTSTLSAEDLEKMFQPFAMPGGELKQNENAGPGLGLYISRGVIEAHGGRVWAEAREQGGGTVFHAILPARPAPLETPQDDADE